MIDLSDLDNVKSVQANIKAVFVSPAGIEVLRFLDSICGWYDFSEENPDRIMIQHGKRQVLATIKTFLDLRPDQIVAIAKSNKEY